MRVLGIDPGSVVVGFGCVDVPARSETRAGHARIRNQVSLRSKSGRVRLLDAGAIRLGARGSPLGRRLSVLDVELQKLLERWCPDEMAVEEAFYGKSVQSALRIGESRGVILLSAARAGVPVSQYPPAMVKLKVAGAGGTSKEALARMVAASLGCTLEGLQRDATDALALALCHILMLERIASFGGDLP